MKTRTIEVQQLARIEGESSLRVIIEEDAVQAVQLAIFEPPRYFEALLQGRSFREAPDITARICGICPVAYQMSACHAMERAAGVQLPAPLRALRRLLYCGEWIESHALHVHMLHAPDFFGHADAIALAQLAPAEAKRGLAMKKTGNAIVALLGGREIHPINVKVGGFYRLPERKALLELLPQLHAGREAAADTVRWVAGLQFPDYQSDAVLVALQHADEYPMNEGRIASSSGLDIEMAAFDAHFTEQQVPYSNALQACLASSGERYLTGPMARFALNHARLTPLCRELAEEAGLGSGTRNPYQSIIVRSLEVLYAFEEAIRIVEESDTGGVASVEVEVNDASAVWATEAPRGLLVHQYDIDAAGNIARAKIVPPTSQNQGVIEHDLYNVVERHLQEDDAALARRCEDAVRNHDPCISCATHFLKVDIDRR
jgi:coenzyme F420-reducing hydrogenase alpha subunit